MKKLIASIAIAVLLSLVIQGIQVSAESYVRHSIEGYGGNDNISALYLSIDGDVGLNQIKDIIQLTISPTVNQYIRYAINITVEMNGSKANTGNLDNFNYTLPDTDIDYNITNITLTHENGTTANPTTAILNGSNITLAFKDINFVFFVAGGGVENYSFNITFFKKPIFTPIQISTSQSGSSYSSTFNLSDQGIDLGIANMSIVLAPSDFDRREGGVSSVTVGSDSTIFCCANQTQLTIYPFLNTTELAVISWSGTTEGGSPGGGSSSGTVINPFQGQPFSLQALLNSNQSQLGMKPWLFGSPECLNTHDWSPNHPRFM